MLLCACLSGAGCAGHKALPPPPPPVRGYVNLDALVRQSPGWDGVGQYDLALERLERAEAGSPAPPADPSVRLAALSGLAALPPGAAGGPPAASRLEVTQLEATQRSLLAGFAARRALTRDEQVARRRALWRREARRLFPVPAQVVTISPDLSLQLLRLNVESLSRTLENWKRSSPPSPKLDALRAKVEADRARLLALLDVRERAARTAQEARVRQIADLRAARLAYAQTQADVLAARLRGGDARALAAQRARLSGERDALLLALARPAPLALPAAGALGDVSLPGGPGARRAALSESALRAARTRLAAQKARWVRYLYDDTRAAAQDAAQRRRWDVTFGPPRAGGRDLTDSVAAALRAGAWRVE